MQDESPLAVPRSGPRQAAAPRPPAVRRATPCRPACAGRARGGGLRRPLVGRLAGGRARVPGEHRPRGRAAGGGRRSPRGRLRLVPLDPRRGGAAAPGGGAAAATARRRRRPARRRRRRARRHRLRHLLPRGAGEATTAPSPSTSPRGSTASAAAAATTDGATTPFSSPARCMPARGGGRRCAPPPAAVDRPRRAVLSCLQREPHLRHQQPTSARMLIAVRDLQRPLDSAAAETRTCDGAVHAPAVAPHRSPHPVALDVLQSSPF